MQKSDTCARYRTVWTYVWTIDTSPKLQTLDAIVDHSGEATLAPVLKPLHPGPKLATTTLARLKRTR